MDTNAVQLGDLKKIHEQANYTNAIPNTIVEQLNQLSVKTDSKKDVASSSAKPSPFTESISKPLVKLGSIPKANVESLSKIKGSNLYILRTIPEQIKDLDISAKNKVLVCLDKTYRQKDDSTSSSTEEEAITSSSDQEEVIATIQNSIKEEEEPLALNKIKTWRNTKTSNCYPRPTPFRYSI